MSRAGQVRGSTRVGPISRAAAAVVAAAVAGTLLTGAPAGAAPEQPPADGQGPAPQGRTATVTLITGDRVVVAADGSVARLVRGEGRGKTPIAVRREAGHTYVIPLDAQRLVDQGVLDRALFDVTRLIADGYDD